MVWGFDSKMSFFPIFVGILALLMFSVMIGLDFLAWFAWILISTFIVFYLIKAILGTFKFLTSGTMSEMEKNEGHSLPSGFKAGAKNLSEFGGDLIAKGENTYTISTRHTNESLSKGFKGLIDGFFRIFE